MVFYNKDNDSIIIVGVRSTDYFSQLYRGPSRSAGSPGSDGSGRSAGSPDADGSGSGKSGDRARTRTGSSTLDDMVEFDSHLEDVDEMRKRRGVCSYVVMLSLSISLSISISLSVYIYNIFTNFIFYIFLYLYHYYYHYHYH